MNYLNKVNIILMHVIFFLCNTKKYYRDQFLRIGFCVAAFFCWSSLNILTAEVEVNDTEQVPTADIADEEVHDSDADANTASTVLDNDDDTEDDSDFNADDPLLLKDRLSATRSWIAGGYFEAGVDATGARGETDVDLHQSLRLRLSPPNADNIRFDGWLWLHENLDQSSRRSSVLRDINEAWDSAVRLRVPHLYVEFDDLWGDSTMRIGRQRIREGIAFSRIDGIYYKQSLEHFDWYVFFGTRASLYDEHLFRDLVYGGGIASQINTSTRLALDVYYAQQKRRPSQVVRPGFIPTVMGRAYPRTVRRTLDDNLYTLKLWQDIGQYHRLYGQFTLNNGRSDELLLDITGINMRWDLTYQLSYRARLQRVGDRVNDIAYFYRILGNYERYNHFLASVQKPLTERLSLSLEGEIHKTRGEIHPYGTNRNYERYASILSMSDVGPGLDLTAALERWNVSGGEGLWAITGEVRKRWERLDAGVGVDFQRYKDVLVEYNALPYMAYQSYLFAVPGAYHRFIPGIYLTDTWTVTTRENVYGIFLRLNWKIDDRHEFRTRITLEKDDGPRSPYWRVQSEYTYRF